MVSRTAIGLIWGTVAWLGTSDFLALTGTRLGEAALDLAAPPGRAFLAVPAAGVAVAVPGAGFDSGFAPVAGFAAESVAGLAAIPELLAGLVVAFGPAGAPGELGAALCAGLFAGGAGLTAEVVGAAGFGACAFLVAAASAEAG